MIRRLFIAFACLLLAVLGVASTVDAGPYRVAVVTDPAVPMLGKVTLEISVTAQKQAVVGADVRVIAQMPGMPMGEREVVATPVAGKPGSYSAPATLAMEGAYEVRVSVNSSKGKAVAVIPIQTGQSTATSSIDYGRIFLWAIAFVVVGIALISWRRSGAKLSLGAASSLLLLAAALAIAVYAVNHFRRPGSMTPLEAQGMEMSTPAPEGATPVTLVTAHTQPFSAGVQYTGQAKGFVEQDVIARVTGTLEWMPFYVGDRVTKGEVLAKLDTSQLQPQLAEKQAGLQSAQAATSVAQSDFAQAQSALREAHAELQQYGDALDESKSTLTSAQEDRKAAQAELESSTAELANATAAVDAAVADQTYLLKQADRSEKLYQAGAISLDQAQRTKSEALKADAAVAQAKQAVLAGEARVRADQANLRKADALIAVAQKRVDQSESVLEEHRAHMQTAQAGVTSASRKVSLAQSDAKQAAATLSGAAASESYATITAQTDGVITDRLISPGTLVNEGQAIVRVAQVSPIRLQANVAESDLHAIREGATVKIWHRGIDEHPILTKVTSVSPSIDPMARTGVVEAVVTNNDARFLPGQFITMSIATSDQRTAITIPRNALWHSPDSSSKSFVWVAEKSGSSWVARKREVQTGASSGDAVGILSGLRDGDQVVQQGGAGLVDGQEIAPQSTDSNESDGAVQG